MSALLDSLDPWIAKTVYDAIVWDDEETSADENESDTDKSQQEQKQTTTTRRSRTSTRNNGNHHHHHHQQQKLNKLYNKSKIVQVLKVVQFPPANERTTAGESTGLSFLIVSDTQNYIAIFLPPSYCNSNNSDDKVCVGSIITIHNWQVSSSIEYAGTYFSRLIQYDIGTICLTIDNSISDKTDSSTNTDNEAVLDHHGGENIGIVGSPVNVNIDTDVCRAVDSMTHFTLVQRLNQLNQKRQRQRLRQHQHHQNKHQQLQHDSIRVVVTSEDDVSSSTKESRKENLQNRLQKLQLQQRKQNSDFNNQLQQLDLQRQEQERRQQQPEQDQDQQEEEPCEIMTGINPTTNNSHINNKIGNVMDLLNLNPALLSSIINYSERSHRDDEIRKDIEKTNHSLNNCDREYKNKQQQQTEQQRQIYQEQKASETSSESNNGKKNYLDDGFNNSHPIPAMLDTKTTNDSALQQLFSTILLESNKQKEQKEQKDDNMCKTETNKHDPITRSLSNGSIKTDMIHGNKDIEIVLLDEIGKEIYSSNPMATAQDNAHNINIREDETNLSRRNNFHNSNENSNDDEAREYNQSSGETTNSDTIVENKNSHNKQINNHEAVEINFIHTSINRNKKDLAAMNAREIQRRTQQQFIKSVDKTRSLLDPDNPLTNHHHRNQQSGNVNIINNKKWAQEKQTSSENASHNKLPEDETSSSDKYDIQETTPNGMVKNKKNTRSIFTINTANIDQVTTNFADTRSTKDSHSVNSNISNKKKCVQEKQSSSASASNNQHTDDENPEQERNFSDEKEIQEITPNDMLQTEQSSSREDNSQETKNPSRKSIICNITANIDQITTDIEDARITKETPKTISEELHQDSTEKDSLEEKEISSIQDDCKGIDSTSDTRKGKGNILSNMIVSRNSSNSSRTELERDDDSITCSTSSSQSGFIGIDDLLVSQNQDDNDETDSCLFPEKKSKSQKKTGDSNKKGASLQEETSSSMKKRQTQKSLTKILATSRTSLSNSLPVNNLVADNHQNNTSNQEYTYLKNHKVTNQSDENLNERDNDTTEDDKNEESSQIYDIGVPSRQNNQVEKLIDSKNNSSRDKNNNSLTHESPILIDNIPCGENSLVHDLQSVITNCSTNNQIIDTKVVIKVRTCPTKQHHLNELSNSYNTKVEDLCTQPPLFPQDLLHQQPVNEETRVTTPLPTNEHMETEGKETSTDSSQNENSNSEEELETNDESSCSDENRVCDEASKQADEDELVNTPLDTGNKCSSVFGIAKAFVDRDAINVTSNLNSVRAPLKRKNTNTTDNTCKISPLLIAQSKRQKLKHNSLSLSTTLSLLMENEKFNSKAIGISKSKLKQKILLHELWERGEWFSRN